MRYIKLFKYYIDYFDEKIAIVDIDKLISIKDELTNEEAYGKVLDLDGNKVLVEKWGGISFTGATEIIENLQKHQN